MDPFQNASRGFRAFRAVPMTHHTTVSEHGWPLPPREANQSAPSDPFSRGSTVLPRRDGLLGAEADNACNQNVRKWQQFGLRVATSDTPAPVLPPVQQQRGLNHTRTEPVQAPAHHSNRAAVVGEEREKGPRERESSGTVQTRIGLVRDACPPAAAAGGGPSLLADSAAPPHKSQAQTRELDVVEIVDIDCHTPPPQKRDADPSKQFRGNVSVDRSPSSPAPAAPGTAPTAIITPAGDNADDAGAEAARRLQRTLAQLSEKVQQSAEERRCGPPKRQGGGGKPEWASKRRGGKTAKAKGKADAEKNDEEGDDVAEEGSNSMPPGGEEAKGKSSTKKGAATRKRGRTSGASAAEAPASKKGGTRRRGGADDSGANAPRTLFSFSATSAGLDAARSMAGLAGVPTAAATVSVPFVYHQTTTEELFSDVRRVLADPDRIQAPPLFVGISTLASDGAGSLPSVECRTNFTYNTTGSKTVKGRASSCFSSVDPVNSHRHVELVVVRWKDAVHALPAQTLGFPFLCRVLAELPGVEVITFNAQAVLIALLAHCRGTLWSNCISDVRVMAWMAQLHVGGATASSARSAFGTVEGSGGGGEADMNVLYDYEQLQLRLSGGKPPPSVLLDKASAAEYYNGSGSAAHAAGGLAATPPATDDSTAPPLTPAQRVLAQHVYHLAPVYRSLYGLLGSKGLLQAFLRQEKRVALLLALMRYSGIGVALAEVHRSQKSCEAEMSRQRSAATLLVPEMGDEFNIQSHDQCRRALYEVLQLGKFLTAKTHGGGEAAAGTGLTITKGGRLSTAEETLRTLAPHHEFPACLLKYRKASKLMQTYVEGMMSYAIVRSERTSSGAVAAPAGVASRASSPAQPRSVDVEEASNPFVDRQLGATSGSAPSPANAASRLSADEEASVTAVGDDVTLPGCGYATIHPNFLQEGTDTGRLSCVEPNLQNLPRNGGLSAPAATATADGEESEEDLLGFRRCFVAPAGSVLLSVDYQQIELRVLAHLCGDKSLVDALTSSADIHRAIAEVVFKKKPVSSEERTLAKRVVFGMLYGAGPKTLAAHMGVTVERALHITSLLTNAFPGIETYHRRVVEESRVNGFVRTISGRLRYLPDIQSTVMARRSYAERQAFNSVVQGSAADVMKMAMLAVARDVLQPYSSADVCLISQIHDEMVFSVRRELLPTVVPAVSSAMSHAMHLLVPLSVTVKFGPSLGELQEWDVEHDLGLGVDA